MALDRVKVPSGHSHPVDVATSATRGEVPERAMKDRASLLLAASLWIAPSAVAQATWIVDRWNRPGADFTDLPAAVTAASDGDLLLLRATSPAFTAADMYSAPPLIDGKGLRIVGERQSIPVTIDGAWTIRNLRADQRLVIDGIQSIQFFALFYIRCESCAGPVLFHRSTFRGQGFPLQDPMTQFTDCELVVMSQCSINPGDASWGFVRSRLMVHDSVIEQVQTGFGTHMPGTLRLTDSELWIAGGRVEGSSEFLSHHVASSPLWLCRSVVHLSAGARVIGGTTLGGFRYEGFLNTCVFDPDLPEVHYDASVQILGGLAPWIDYFATPQVGVRTTQQGTTLTIRQDYGQPSSATLLLIGAIQTPPWSAGIGPVFVDPTAVWSDLRLGPQPSLVLQSFAIPPGVPLGTQLGVQAFGWTPAGGFLTSNLATIGF
ncbi:MAG: hypothetical protein AB7O97_13845 [Planctomycetota bacterium]